MKIPGFDRNIKIVTGACPRCGKSFEASERVYTPGTSMCRECTRLVMKINQMQRQLIVGEFSLEQEDEKIAQQINDVLAKESEIISESGEELTTSLIEKLIADEKRRKKILKHLRKLQKNKKST